VALFGRGGGKMNCPVRLKKRCRLNKVWKGRGDILRENPETMSGSPHFGASFSVFQV
jgi:hypothetical protein